MGDTSDFTEKELELLKELNREAMKLLKKVSNKKRRKSYNNKKIFPYK